VKTIPYGRQDVVQSDIDAVVATLRSDFLTQGPTVPRFEELVSRHVGARHGVAMNSATSALHIACLALDLRPGDLLWTVPNTFVASANCARYCGADVDFVDIDPLTWNMSVAHLRQKLVLARAANRSPKIVVPVHFSGQPTEQEQIWQLAEEYGFRIIDDASHSIGATRKGERVGSGRWAHVTVFSFHPVKIITTGEGGMLMTNDDELAHRAMLLRSHGITRDAKLFRNIEPLEKGAWYYEQQILGFNYRMTDIHAALGYSQMGRLEENVARRNTLAQRYDRKLKGLPLQLPAVDRANRSAFHLYVVRLKPTTAKTHLEIFAALRDRGIGVNLHYTPVHLQPYYRDLGFSEGQYPEAEAYAQQAITLPLYPTLSDEEQDLVITALEEVL
jgi:UDP-4-amino-4,6-dideoxy-N-acetyl-beta-L-altrosamine transaminase